MAETDPKLIEEIDAIVPDENGTAPDQSPKDPAPVVPNGGPYETQTEPQPAN